MKSALWLLFGFTLGFTASYAVIVRANHRNHPELDGEMFV